MEICKGFPNRYTAVVEVLALEEFPRGLEQLKIGPEPPQDKEKEAYGEENGP